MSAKLRFVERGADDAVEIGAELLARRPYAAPRRQEEATGAPF